MLQAEKEEQGAIEKAPAAKDEQEQWMEQSAAPAAQQSNIDDWASEITPVVAPAVPAPAAAAAPTFPADDWSAPTQTTDWSAAPAPAPVSNEWGGSTETW